MSAIGANRKQSTHWPSSTIAAGRQRTFNLFLFARNLIPRLHDYGTAGFLGKEHHTTMMPQIGENCEMNVVRFRPRDTVSFPNKHPLDDSSKNICELLNLSRYELRDHSSNDVNSHQDVPDNFNYRMRTNLMALIFLVALAALAAVDVLKLMPQI
jgi:hypothetical protein